MSKLSDYSRFDHIGDGSSDDEDADVKVALPPPPAKVNPQGGNEARQQQQLQPEPPKTTQQPISAHPSSTTPAAGPSMRKNEETGRYIYEFNGRPIYEWEQKLEDVTLYVPAPPVASSQIHCKIFAHRLELGVKALIEQQGKYFIKEETFGLVEVSESTWYVEDSIIVIYLAKAKKGEVWDVALKGSHDNQNSNQRQTVSKVASAALDPMAKQEIQKEMMLERFQEENPGMDFRGAEFNGGVPDPRTFMGGVKYS